MKVKLKFYLRLTFTFFSLIEYWLFESVARRRDVVGQIKD